MKKSFVLNVIQSLYPDIPPCEHGKHCGECFKPEDLIGDPDSIFERIDELILAEKQLDKLQGQINIITNTLKSMRVLK